MWAMTDLNPQEREALIVNVLRVRSGGHFEAVRDQTDGKFRDDARAILAALAAREEPRTDDQREFVLWADHTWTGGNEESNEIENGTLNVVPKAAREGPSPETWGVPARHYLYGVA
jgi:hypothetical protein